MTIACQWNNNNTVTKQCSKAGDGLYIHQGQRYIPTTSCHHLTIQGTGIIKESVYIFWYNNLCAKHAQ